jgi:exodeoxyribonuclease VII large subunit
MDTQTPASNVPEYTVSEIAGAVKRTLEGAFGRVRVRGELVEVKRYSSGHTYLCLKDEGGTLRGIIWKTAARTIGLKPEDGVEVIATGRISAYGDKSQFQIIIERLEYAGAGAMLARIEALRVKLAAEGLFNRRRPLPTLPAVVGVVTSANGAVLHDIHTTIARRFGRPILLWPVPVQGEGAAEKIAAAIAGFCGLPRDGVPRPDVLIVARGGGSLEDLMAFNDEAVVRAAAGCSIPLISAVGHETDHTLIDLAADRRAPTPTAAAEMAVPVRLELLADLQQRGARQSGALARMIGERRMHTAGLASRLPDVASLAGSARHRLDDRGHRLALAMPNLLAGRWATLVRVERALPDAPALLQTARQALADHGVRLRHGLPALVAARRAALLAAERHMPPPASVLAAIRHRTDTAAAGLPTALRHAVQRHRIEAARTLPRLTEAPVRAKLREMTARLEGLSGRLQAADPRAVLARGYALVTDPAGRPVTSAAAVRPAARLRLEFADGAVEVQRVSGRGEKRQQELAL